MNRNWNKLLARQIKRHFGSPENIPANLSDFLGDINDSYENFTSDIQLLQNSIEISSQELRTAFLKHKQDAERQKETIGKINEAINAIKTTPGAEFSEIETVSADSSFLFDSLIKLIEERNKAEEEILRLSVAVEQNPASIVITNINGNIEYVNPKFCNLTGYSKEEVIGKNPKILKADNNNPETYKELWSTILQGKEWKGEFRNRKKNGEMYWEFASISAVRNLKGEIVSFLAIKEDITKRKQTEETLENERALFRTIIDLIPDAVYVKDTEGRKILANPLEIQYAGKKSEPEIIGKTDFDLYPAEEAARSVKEDHQVLHEGKSILNVEGALKDTEGKIHNLLVSKVPLYDHTGKVTGIVGVSHDITERKNAEEEVRRVSTRLALAALAGGIGVWEFDVTANKLYWDDQMFALFGIEKTHFNDTYETWFNAIHTDEKARVKREIELALNAEKDFNTEFRICWNDGSVHNIRTMATIQTDRQGKPLRMIGANWDITEQKKNEEILQKARIEAEMANNAKSIFLANMSHEIRTPLNAIIGFSQLMNREKYLSETQREYNNSIIRAGEHLLSLINDILELSKMEAGRLEVNPVNIDLYALFADIQLMFKEPARAKRLQLIFDLAPDIPQYVVVDDNKLRRIFINLLGNAIKFTEEGGIAVRIKVDANTNKQLKLVAEIQDSGPGIPAAEMDKLFKHFVQTTSGIKNSSGTGLGLALSRELARLMGGDITVFSEEGIGSVFTFCVELKEGKEVKPHYKHKIIGFENTKKRYKILVVDDIEENLQVVVRLLNSIGFVTNEARNGAEAVSEFEKWNPDLILMDMRMPVMDGYEASRQIKSTAKGKQTPIVALTASSFEDEKRKIGELGINGQIRKPFRENELLETIGNLLSINYITETDGQQLKEDHPINSEMITDGLARLPKSLIYEMLNAIIIADIDVLIDLIRQIENDNSKLARHLMELANNYDYEYLQQILQKQKERK